MKGKFWLVVVFAVPALTWLVFAGCSRDKKETTSRELVHVTYGISPFQDTLVPTLGKTKGWYEEEGLDVTFKILGWTEVQEALAAGSIDVAINNISSIVATHEKRPNLVYFYGFNTFDNGFALMIRPDGKFKTVMQIEKDLGDHEAAVVAAAKQLKNATVITTSNTDMEQGVAAAARRGGLDFIKVKIIDLPPDEGLAAFLSGQGDMYIGGIPQRTRAGKEGMLEMLTGADLGPPPINGLVTTREYAKAHQDVLLTLLHVWFRCVQFIDKNMDEGGTILVEELNKHTGAKFTLDDFKKFWNNYEHYPPTPADIEKEILNPNGRNYWKARWDDCNTYFYNIKGTISKPVTPQDAFLMLEAHKAYLQKYSKQ